jgi:hypothetical protein
MNDSKTRVKAILKRHGANAAAHFGTTEGRLKRYLSTGKWPLDFVDRVLAEENEAGPQPPQSEPEPLAAGSGGVLGGALNTEDDAIRRMLDPNGEALRYLQSREREMTTYLQQTVDFYIKQFSSRLGLLERTVAALSAQQLRLAGMASQTRPDAGVPVDQVYTTNPYPTQNPPNQPPLNALVSGVAPTKEAVDAQASMPIIEGVPIPGARPASPAYGDANSPPFGYGWNKPRPPPRR